MGYGAATAVRIESAGVMMGKRRTISRKPTAPVTRPPEEVLAELEAELKALGPAPECNSGHEKWAENRLDWFKRRQEIERRIRYIRTLKLPDRAGATVERLLQDPGGVAEVYAYEGRRQHTVQKVVTQCPLDRYWKRQELDPGHEGNNTRLYNAGDQLRDDHYQAGLEPRIVGSYSAQRYGPRDLDRQVKALQHYREAMAAVGPALAPVLVHVVCLDGSASDWAHGVGWKRPAEGLVALRLALESLAAHYRMPVVKEEGKAS